MLFDQSFLNLILIATFLLGLSGFAVVIIRKIKTCPGYSWSKR